MSRSFLPSLGGIETTTDALARAWAAAGHEVTIATETLSAEDAPQPGIALLRGPSRRALLRAARAADLVWHNHLSLRAAWTQALAWRPWVVTHQGWLRRSDGTLTPGYRVKRAAARAAHAVAISRAIAADLPVAATVIPNPYRDRLFRTLDGPRRYELAFLGRLVTDKGARAVAGGTGPPQTRRPQPAAADRRRAGRRRARSGRGRTSSALPGRCDSRGPCANGRWSRR